MFKKLNYTTLIIILAIVLGIYFITELIGQKERTFREIVMEIDTSGVTEISISPPDKPQSVLVKEGNNWMVVIDGKSYQADDEVVKSILDPLVKMKTLKPAATSPDAWRDLKVDDSTGIHVVIKDSKDELADFYIGKMGFMQPPEGQNNQQINPYQRRQPTMFAHVRLADENLVYAVEGYLNMSYNLLPKHFRVKNLTKINKNDITKISFNYPGELSYQLVKRDTVWNIEEKEPDSTKTVRYLANFTNLRANEFVDEEMISGLNPEFELVVEGNNFSPVTILAYPSGEEGKYYITSSKNKDGVFDGSAANLYSRLFVEKDHFFPKE